MTNFSLGLKSVIRSEGMLLAVVPFIGSLIALCYEVGCLTYFDVPFEYVDVGFNRIVAATAALSVPIIMLWIYLAQIVRFFEAKHPLSHVVGRSMIYTLIPLAGVLLRNESAKELLIPFGVFVFFICAYLFPPFFRRNKECSYWERVRDEIEEDDASFSSNAARRRSGKFLDILLVPFSVAIFGGGFCGYLGYSSARAEQWRWVLEDDQSYLAVRKYGEVYIFKQFDPSTNMLSDSMLIRKLDAGKAIKLKKIKIGNILKPPSKKIGD